MSFLEWLQQDMHIAWAMLSVGVAGMILFSPRRTP
jgi:hypothetical protein